MLPTGQPMFSSQVASDSSYLLVELSFKSLSEIKKNYENIINFYAQRPGLAGIKITQFAHKKNRSGF